MSQTQRPIQLSPLWAATAPEPVDYPVFAGQSEADCVVIGAGLSGLSTAIHLAENGLLVVVLEAADPGAGGSGRSGGQVIPGLRHDPAELIDTYGPEFGRRAYEFGAMAADVAFDFIARHQIACDARRNGWIQAADSAETLAKTQMRVALWQKTGAPVRMLPRDEFQALTGSPAYLGGMIDERGGTVQPLGLVRGLAKRAAELGVKIYSHSPASKLERDGHRWRIETPQGIISTPKVLVATNAQSGQLWPDLDEMILPVWSFQIATAPLSGELRQKILPSEPAVSDLRRVLRYFRVDRDHRLVVGGKGTIRAPRHGSDFSLQRQMLAQIYPMLGDIPIDYAWGGQVAITLDRLPRIVSLGTGALASLGCNGKGVAWCLALGKVLAEALVEDKAANLPIPIRKIDPIPFHGLRQIYVAAGSTWLRLRDGLEHSFDKGKSS
jgi:glycine/D-amino acid oxidase-like deaminating enzyme